jgi:hypothetical protein
MTACAWQSGFSWPGVSSLDQLLVFQLGAFFDAEIPAIDPMTTRQARKTQIAMRKRS